MSKVQYFTACTLDGFIADENNSLDWLYEVPHDEKDEYWDQWFPSVGGLVMGATTYEWMLEHDGPEATLGEIERGDESIMTAADEDYALSEGHGQFFSTEAGGG